MMLTYVLANHWIYATPLVKYVDLEKQEKTEHVISSISCDDSVLVCGMGDDTAKVYDLINFSLVAILNRRPLDEAHEAHYVEVRIFQDITKDTGSFSSDIGKDVVATVTQSGDVSVWKRSDWSNLYKQSHHRNLPATAVKVLPKKLKYIAAIPFLKFKYMTPILLLKLLSFVS